MLCDPVLALVDSLCEQVEVLPVECKLAQWLQSREVLHEADGMVLSWAGERIPLSHTAMALEELTISVANSLLAINAPEVPFRGDSPEFEALQTKFSHLQTSWADCEENLRTLQLRWAELLTKFRRPDPQSDLRWIQMGKSGTPGGFMARLDVTNENEALMLILHENKATGGLIMRTSYRKGEESLKVVEPSVFGSALGTFVFRQEINGHFRLCDTQRQALAEPLALPDMTLPRMVRGGRGEEA